MHVLAKGQIPHTRHVRGSNYNLISVFEDRLSGRAIVVSGTVPHKAFQTISQLPIARLVERLQLTEYRGITWCHLIRASYFRAAFIYVLPESNLISVVQFWII